MRTIFLDVDGVIRNIVKAIIQKMREEGIPVRPVTDWNTLFKNGITFADIFYSFPYLLVIAPPYQRAHFFTRNLSHLGEIVFLSMQNDYGREATVRWLNNKGFLAYGIDVQFVSEAREKLWYLERYKDSILIDDHPDLEGEKNVLTIGRTWNKSRMGYKMILKQIEAFNKSV